MRSETYWVYILRCADASLYIGSTNHLERRLATHRSGKGSKYVRSRLPVRMVWSEEHVSKSSALVREAALKRLTKFQKENLLRSNARTMRE